MTVQHKINEQERKCLEALVALTSTAGERCIGFQYIADETNLTKKEVRRYVRSLARKGFAEFYRGLMDEDGMAAGSGYCVTGEGIEFCDSLTTIPAHQ